MSHGGNIGAVVQAANNTHIANRLIVRMVHLLSGVNRTEKELSPLTFEQLYNGCSIQKQFAAGKVIFDDNATLHTSYASPCTAIQDSSFGRFHRTGLDLGTYVVTRCFAYRSWCKTIGKNHSIFHISAVETSCYVRLLGNIRSRRLRNRLKHHEPPTTSASQVSSHE